MAGHAGTADLELIDQPPGDDATPTAADIEVEPETAAVEASSPRQRAARAALAAAVIAAMVLGGLVGWIGYGDYRGEQDRHDEQSFVAIGRQAAIDLTTIDFNHVDADVARILDSATGTFNADFQKRAQPFAEVVKQAKSTSNGTVTEAGLESRDGDHAQVLVAVQVTTSTDGSPVGDPRSWRMRIGVQKIGNDFKVADVTFVP